MNTRGKGFVFVAGVVIGVLASGVVAAVSATQDSSPRTINLPGRTTSAPFSDAVLAGDTLYVAGRLGMDPETGRSRMSMVDLDSQTYRVARDYMIRLEAHDLEDQRSAETTAAAGGMTIDELHTLWGPDAEGKLTRWNQVRSEWPDEEIRLYGPGVDSGTFDYFTEVVNHEGGASRGDYTASEDDNVLVQGIAGDKHSLGFFGYAYYVENQDKLRLVGIDGGAGCVTPNDATIEDGSYQPLARPLFIYIRKDALANPHIEAFANFHLSPEGGQKLVRDVGYLPYPQEVYTLAQDRVTRGLAGTLFGGDNPQKGPVAAVLANNK